MNGSNGSNGSNGPIDRRMNGSSGSNGSNVRVDDLAAYAVGSIQKFSCTYFFGVIRSKGHDKTLENKKKNTSKN